MGGEAIEEGGLTPQQWRNEFAISCFRDVADRDYISARMNYIMGLDE